MTGPFLQSKYLWVSYPNQFSAWETYRMYYIYYAELLTVMIADDNMRRDPINRRWPKMTAESDV